MSSTSAVLSVASSSLSIRLACLHIYISWVAQCLPILGTSLVSSGALRLHRAAPGQPGRPVRILPHPPLRRRACHQAVSAVHGARPANRNMSHFTKSLRTNQKYSLRYYYLDPIHSSASTKVSTVQVRGIFVFWFGLSEPSSDNTYYQYIPS